MSSAKRLLKELSAYEKDLSPALDSLHPVNEKNLFIWEAVLRGPPDSDYEGGRWTIMIDIPNTYPLHPPKMKFKNMICHPNVHPKTGEICIDVLKTQWTPAWTVMSALTAVQAMLTDPEPNSPLNVDAANLIRCGDSSAYSGLIRYYTVKYGHKMPL